VIEPSRLPSFPTYLSSLPEFESIGQVAAELAQLVKTAVASVNCRPRKQATAIFLLRFRSPSDFLEGNRPFLPAPSVNFRTRIVQIARSRGCEGISFKDTVRDLRFLRLDKVVGKNDRRPDDDGV
jgi:hypothetical protein